MIITRTPFRVTLGGGGTDLPSYYSCYGGFIFSFAINKYMYINVNRPVVDNLIRINYSDSETVENISDLKHNIARACLEKHGITHSIEIASMADIPSGSGLGSSSSYTVGLLNALHTLKRDYFPLQDLAEEACKIEIDILQKPMGKQDQYLAAFGGFSIMEISKEGVVQLSQAKVPSGTLDELKKNLLLFYTGVNRKNNKILGEQSRSTEKSKKDVLESLHYIKKSGYRILEIIESGNITELGKMFDEHWQYKKRMAKGITNPEFNTIYDAALKNGAIGGKITGAGGGGFFLFYCEEGKHKLQSTMADMGLREMKFDFDFEGTKILANFMTYRENGA
jgi:D-glycero-alpha-D-manno-heptose-7-phosphate kinase